MSVFQLMVRSNFYRVLSALAVMAVLQTGLFWFALKKGGSQEGFGLEYVVEKSHIGIVFLIVFVILCSNL